MPAAASEASASVPDSVRGVAEALYPGKSPQAYFLPGCWWRVSAMTVYPEKYLPCSPGSYTVPLLKHGCAELASAQYPIPAKRVFHQLMGFFNDNDTRFLSGKMSVAGWQRGAVRLRRGAMPM